jgi:hypothetical protein
MEGHPLITSLIIAAAAWLLPCPRALAQPAAPAGEPSAPAVQAASPQEQLAQRLHGIDPSDTAALIDAGLWAAHHGLEKQANELLARVIGLDTDNPRAREALRQVRIGAQWYGLAQGAQVLAGQVTAAGYDAATAAIIEQMRDLAQTAEEKAAVEALYVHVRLCQGDFDAAAGSFAALAQTAPEGSAVRTRLSIIAQILQQNRDGLYVLTAPYPAAALLLDEPENVVPAGPASLADSRVLTAALHDKAGAFLAEGGRQLDQARLLDAGDVQAIEQACQRALAQFDQADALVMDVARGYRVDVARCRIDVLRRRAQEAAAGFDAELDALGLQELSRQAYAEKLARLLNAAQQVRQDLELILRLAQPYPRELVMEIRWAQEDRARLRNIQLTLRRELREQ